LKDKSFKNYLRKLRWRICSYCGFIIAIVVVLVLFNFGVFQKYSNSNSIDDIFLKNYDVATLGNTESDRVIKYGYELFKSTPNYIGPNNGNPEMVYAGNNLSCNNCHLYAGTKPYSAPLIGIIQRFPQYRGRENKIGTIEERIDGCMERSMNGRKMPPNSKEMKALVSYLNWLSRFAPEDGNIEGKGFLSVTLPNRPINLNNGKRIFNSKCAFCHTEEGKGVKKLNSNVYEYPALWGDDSFNNGSGINRVITAAQFIKGNMPYGTTYDSPMLTDEEAYDVAGYINQQQRPTKPNLEVDFPDLKKKPVSTPYPPYADNFSIEQHQKGPFQPIIDFYETTYGIIKTK
jgi:thiosulfate dehydrogenase